MDLGMPELGGIEATERIVGANPGIRVIVITLYDDEQSVRAALAAGASGYVVKQAPPERDRRRGPRGGGRCTVDRRWGPRPGFGAVRTLERRRPAVSAD